MDNPSGTIASTLSSSGNNMSTLDPSDTVAPSSVINTNVTQSPTMDNPGNATANPYETITPIFSLSMDGNASVLPLETLLPTIVSSGGVSNTMIPSGTTYPTATSSGEGNSTSTISLSVGSPNIKRIYPSKLGNATDVPVGILEPTAVSLNSGSNGTFMPYVTVALSLKSSCSDQLMDSPSGTIAPTLSSSGEGLTSNPSDIVSPSSSFDTNATQSLTMDGTGNAATSPYQTAPPTFTLSMDRIASVWPLEMVAPTIIPSGAVNGTMIPSGTLSPTVISSGKGKYNITKCWRFPCGNN